MLKNFFKFVLIFLFFQYPLYSKNKTFNEVNSRNLYNYFSGIIAYNNQDNLKALNFFRSSNFLIKEHDSYLEKYIYSLVLEGKVQQATNKIKQNLTANNSNFFEAHLILALDSLKKKNYKKSREHLNQSSTHINNDRISLIIVETLKEYLFLFEENKLPNIEKKFGNFSLINEVFQRCYLDDKKIDNYFNKIINTEDDSNYSRYIFFYINYLIDNDRYEEAKFITDKVDYLNSSLLISQAKLWIENGQIEEFKKVFSCKNSHDIISELFFIVANICSSK